jgi:abelson tyrosine-protein kinase 1
LNGANFGTVGKVPEMKKGEANAIVPSASTTSVSAASQPSTQSDSGLSRAHSLRDLASKFEQLQSKSPVDAQKSSVTQLARVPEKRFSMLEGPAGESSSVKMERHLSTPPPTLDEDTPAVSKEYLVELYRKLEGCLQDLRNGRLPRKTVRTPESLLTLLVRFSDVVQQFHNTCGIYAENISPHSKFRYRELLNRVELSNRQLRQCASASSDESKVLGEVEQTVRHIMQLVNR